MTESMETNLFIIFIRNHYVVDNFNRILVRSPVSSFLGIVLCLTCAKNYGQFKSSSMFNQTFPAPGINALWRHKVCSYILFNLSVADLQVYSNLSVIFWNTCTPKGIKYIDTMPRCNSTAM